MEKKVCLITGANTGIGKIAATEIARQGYRVVMANRDSDKSRAAQEDIKKESGNDDVTLLTVDLASLQSVHELANKFLSRFDRLDVLVNNAGVWMGDYEKTGDGLEKTFAVNHFAHFLLTTLLLDLLKKSSPSRIVVTSSEGEKIGGFDLDNFMDEKQFGSIRTYCRTKRANLHFIHELARRIEGSGVTVNALHPGPVKTDLFRASTLPWWFKASLAIGKPFLRTPEKGAQTIIYLATSPDVEGVSGKYFVDKKPRRSTRASYDETKEKQLWELSEKLTAAK